MVYMGLAHLGARILHGPEIRAPARMATITARPEVKIKIGIKATAALYILDAVL